MQNDIVMRYSKLEARTALVEGRDCDEYDYMIAASCGVIAGLVDSFFVGKPGESILQKNVDKAADEFVKKAAQTFYKFDKRTKGKPRKMPESLEQCISYLEQAFPVPYDARYRKDLDVKGNQLDGMWSGNHHLLSLAHSPDIIGLIFSIIDQFTDMASFIDNGHVIRVKPNKTSGAVPYLQGTDTVSRLFCGFVNWIGHLISDLAGSSSTRKKGESNRGSGIQMPFYELFLFCDFGDIDGNTIAEIATKAFEKGYDARFGAAMAIPVVMDDLFIRIIWALKSHFYHKKSWDECVPTEQHKDLRMMLLVGNAALCAVDGADAAIRSEGNLVNFVLHINMVAWYRLAKRSLKEICIRYDFTYADLQVQYEFLNYKLEIYEQKLSQIDYAAYQQQISELNGIAGFLECGDWEGAAQKMDSYVKRNGIESDVKDFDDFKRKMISGHWSK